MYIQFYDSEKQVMKVRGLSRQKFLMNLKLFTQRKKRCKLWLSAYTTIHRRIMSRFYGTVISKQIFGSNW